MITVDIESYMKWFKELYEFVSNKISSNLYSHPLKDLERLTILNQFLKKESKMVDGRIIIRDNFDKLFTKYDNLIMFGEDVGKIGDVNQGMEGMQKKYGKYRVSDTGIRGNNNYRTGNWISISRTSSNSRNSIFRLYSLLLTNIK